MFIFRLSARQKYNDGFITKWRPVTTFGYRNDFDPRIEREETKLARILKQEISAYKAPPKDIQKNIRYYKHKKNLHNL